MTSSSLKAVRRKADQRDWWSLRIGEAAPLTMGLSKAEGR
jgi:hypothetical protein